MADTEKKQKTNNECTVDRNWRMLLHMRRADAVISLTKVAALTCVKSVKARILKV